ncbi:MAG: lactoylglutathione lyase [bacterium]|nr:lactoylglutathione lyase [bacterium]
MRLLHTMIRVGNLERSINFYKEILGMRLLKKNDYTEGKFTLAFLGYGDISDSTCIELTYNWDQDNYEMGNAFGHIAIEVNDVYKATDKIEKAGGKVIRKAGPMSAGTTIISFVADPDGYAIELIGEK